MSRKDPRRAYSVRLPSRVLRLVRAQQKNSRGRRLMDTARVLIVRALSQDTPPRAPCDKVAATIQPRLLQLPPKERAKLAKLAQTTSLTEEQVICELLMASHGSSTPDY